MLKTKRVFFIPIVALLGGIFCIQLQFSVFADSQNQGDTVIIYTPSQSVEKINIPNKAKINYHNNEELPKTNEKIEYFIIDVGIIILIILFCYFLRKLLVMKE